MNVRVVVWGKKVDQAPHEVFRREPLEARGYIGSKEGHRGGVIIEERSTIALTRRSEARNTAAPYLEDTPTSGLLVQLDDADEKVHKRRRLDVSQKPLDNRRLGLHKGQHLHIHPSPNPQLNQPLLLNDAARKLRSR